MFYFLISPIMSYNFILIAAAIVPAVFLMVRVYRSDRLEPEDTHLLWKLVQAGILSTILALVEERIGSAILDKCVEQDTLLYNVILYFVIVAVAEESSKYLLLKRNTTPGSRRNSTASMTAWSMRCSFPWASRFGKTSTTF